MRTHVWIQRFADRSTLQLQWMDAAGKRKTKSSGTSDADEAERARSDLEYELNHGLHVEPVKMSWQSFREAFEAEYLPSVRANTQKNYRRTLDLFEELSSIPLQLAGVSARHVSAFAAALRSLPSPKRGGMTAYKASSIAVHLEFLKSALSWAAEQKLLAEVPAFPVVRLPLTTPQPVPSELFERLLAAAPDAPMRAYLLLGWLAGLRRDEAYWLQWEACEDRPYLDFHRRRIIFPAASVKGDRDQWVPLDPELQAALESLPRTGPSVFAFHHCPARMSAHVRRLASKAKVRLTYRSLRRGFACRYAGKVPAQVLQKLCRHANIVVTLQYYTSIDSAVEEAVFGKSAEKVPAEVVENV